MYIKSLTAVLVAMSFTILSSALVMAQDVTPPETQITSVPPALSNSQNATYEFVSEDPDDVESSGLSHTECSVDGGSFVTCTSPFEITGLGDSTHTFEVRGVDNAGNVETPLFDTWTIDTTPPLLTFIFSPQASDGYINAAEDGAVTVQYTLTDNIAGITDIFLAVDHASGASCIELLSPIDDGGDALSFSSSVTGSVAGCGDGGLGFFIGAFDLAGNFAWHGPATSLKDTVAPVSLVTSGPDSFTNQTSASLGFDGADSGSGVDFFECSIDGGGFSPCTSPFTASGLAEGEHTLLVRATDHAGNVESTASRTWSVDLTPPDITGSATGTPNASGWFNHNVNIKFDCSDPTSNGVSSGVASGFPTGGGPLKTEGANQSVTGTCTDNAGNTATTTVDNISIDKTPPQIDIVSPQNGQVVMLNESGFVADFNVIDNLTATVDLKLTSTVPNGDPLPSDSLGSHAFSVSATDLAGNSMAVTHRYRVGVNAAPPGGAGGSFIESSEGDEEAGAGSSSENSLPSFDAGDSFGMQFQAVDADGNPIIVTDLMPVLYIAKVVVNDDGTETLEFLEQTLFFTYDPLTNSYRVDVDTAALSLEPGIYQLVIQTHVGTSSFQRTRIEIT